MTIERPPMNPQAQAFHAAAFAMRELRYYHSEVLEDQIASMQAMVAVVTGVAHFYDSHHILEPAAMEAFRAASRLSVPAYVKTNAEVMLTLPLDAAIQGLMLLRDL